MTTETSTQETGTPLTISDYLAERLRVGDPDTTGPVAVYPVFGAAPELEYLTLGRAINAGFTVKELPGGASVRDLLVSNRTGQAVLLFEGEEVLGAQQNRTFDTSILVAAGTEMTVPVSCVEAGRWDGSRSGEDFMRAEQMAYPELRREKARQAGRSRSGGGETRADQGAVWEEVSIRSRALNVASPTGSIHDVYESRRSELRRMAAEIKIHEGQIGALLQIGDRVASLDLVSRPDAYADLHEALVQGYCLDGLTPESRELTAEPANDRAEGFLSQVLETGISEHDGIGLGRDFRFESPALVGSGLVSGTELIQLSAFDDRDRDRETDPAGPARRRTRIRRPSRRHP